MRSVGSSSQAGRLADEKGKLDRDLVDDGLVGALVADQRINGDERIKPERA